MDDHGLIDSHKLLILQATSRMSAVILKGLFGEAGGGEWNRTIDLRVMSPSL